MRPSPFLTDGLDPLWDWGPQIWRLPSCLVTSVLRLETKTLRKGKEGKRGNRRERKGKEKEKTRRSAFIASSPAFSERDPLFYFFFFFLFFFFCFDFSNKKKKRRKKEWTALFFFFFFTLKKVSWFERILKFCSRILPYAVSISYRVGTDTMGQVPCPGIID